MTKWLKRVVFLGLAAVAAVYFVGLAQDHATLEDSVLRLHVVANSDDRTDQAVKLQVRDAVLAELESAMETFPTMEAAKAWLQERIPQIEATANRVLETAGTGLKAVVTLAREKFPERAYDTFKLPAGVYNSLRITIGAGQGHNWWCVLFPTLCVPASSRDFETVAVSAGLSDGLAKTLAEDGTAYEVRFRLLDWLGDVKNQLAG